MQQKQQFQKAVNYFTKQYQITRDSFIQFLNQKVVLSSIDIDCITNRIDSYVSHQPLILDDIIFYMHCVSAVQNYNNIAELEDQEIETFFKIQLKAKEQQKGKKNCQNQFEQKQQNQPSLNQIIDARLQNNYNDYQQQIISQKRQIQPQYQQIKDEEQINQNQYNQYNEYNYKKQQNQFQHKKVISQILIQNIQQSPVKQQEYKSQYDNEQQYNQQLNNQQLNNEQLNIPSKKPIEYQSIIKSPQFNQMHQIKEQTASQRISGIRQDNQFKDYNQQYSKKQNYRQQFKYQQQQEVQQQKIFNNLKQSKLKNAKSIKDFQQKINQSQKFQLKKSQTKNSDHEIKNQKTIKQMQKKYKLQQENNQMNFMNVGDISELNADSQVQIIKYDKTDQDFINIVIKYQIAYNDYKVWRRYSQFQKLMKFLNKKYQGAILPQMPPKEGIKGSLRYFLTLDQQFLNQRKQKLQLLLKRLINSKFVSQDETLNKFLTEQDFEIDEDSQSFLNFSFNSIKDIALILNARQIKDYGLAYYKYLSQAQLNINGQINTLYEKIKKMAQTFTILNNYRQKINENFKKRKDLFRQFELQCNKKSGSQFDKILKEVSQQISDLQSQFKRYIKLKSQQNWIVLLIEQKDEDNKKQYVQKLQSIKIRVKKMQNNLLSSMCEFKQDKQKVLSQIGDKMYLWRANIHP